MVQKRRQNEFTYRELNVSNKATIEFMSMGGVTPSTAALVLAIGASGTRATTATANKNFVEFRVENTATSGDNRGIYNRLYLQLSDSSL